MNTMKSNSRIKKGNNTKRDTNRYYKKMKKIKSKIVTDNKINLSNLDKKYYQKSLLYKCNHQNNQSMNIYKIKNSKIKCIPLGPYINLFSGDGGFCKRIGGNILTSKNNNSLQHENNDIFVNSNNNRNTNGLLKPHNYSYKNITKNNVEKDSSRKKREENSKKIRKGLSRKRTAGKINITELYNDIKFLKLNKENKNNEKKDKQIEIDILNNIKVYNGKNTERNNEGKKNIILRELQLDNNIKNNHKEIKSFRELSKESNENFSMKNTKIKKFNGLTEEYNILLNYYPTVNTKNKKENCVKSSPNNYSIISNHIEYKILKESKPKVTMEIEINDNDKRFNHSINGIPKPSYKRIKSQEDIYADCDNNENKDDISKKCNNDKEGENKGGILKTKNSKHFNRFKAKMTKQLSKISEKEEKKRNVSSKILNIALLLENKFNLEKDSNLEKNNKVETENNNKKYDEIELKENIPVLYKKKKTAKIEFNFD